MLNGTVEIIESRDGHIHRSEHPALIAEDRSTLIAQEREWWAQGSGQYYSQYADIYNGHPGAPGKSARIICA